MKLRVRTSDLPSNVVPRGQYLRVEDARTGELVEGVERVFIGCDGRKSPIALLVVRIGDVDVEGVALSVRELEIPGIGKLVTQAVGQ